MRLASPRSRACLGTFARLDLRDQFVYAFVTPG